MTPTILPLLSSLCAGAAVALAALALGPTWDRVARRNVAKLAPQMNALGLARGRLPLYLRLWGLAMAGAAVVLVFVLGMPLLAVPVVYLIYVAPGYLLTAQIERRKRLLRDQMATASVALANTARAGLALAQGLESVAEETPEPLAGELRRIVHDFHRGRPLAEAIEATKDRLGLEPFSLFAAAILACLERGGRVTEALDGISASLQEMRRLERKLESETAGGRMVVMLLAAFPVLFLVGLQVVDPVGTALLFRTTLGQVVLVVVAALIYAAVKVSQRVMNLEI